MSAAGPDSVVPRAGSAGDRLADGGAGPLRLMAVHAHPDDESSKGAATMARYVREGVEVLVCTLTGGERGDILNKAMDQPEVRANLPLIRREEMAKARDILGVRQQFLGFVDSGLPEGDPLPPLPDGCFALQPLEVAAKPLVKAVREFKPHVMLTYDDARFVALHEKMLEQGLESPYAERLAELPERASDPARKVFEVTTRVPCGDYFEVRDQALIAHATQVDPNGGWFLCPVDVQREAWPTEDYHLARSIADAPAADADDLEDDLFAGIREKVRC